MGPGKNGFNTVAIYSAKLHNILILKLTVATTKPGESKNGNFALRSLAREFPVSCTLVNRLSRRKRKPRTRGSGAFPIA